MMNRTARCLLLLWVSFAVSVSAEWNMKEFMITEWGRPELNDEDIAKAAVNAGITHIFWTSDKLDLCSKYGLKVLVEQATPEIAKKIADHPALWGYYLIDEPYPESEFPPLADKINSMRQADPRHPSFINVLSTTGDFLRTYMEVVKPEILSFDYYTWFWGSDRYYEKLEQFREAAMLANVPLTSCIETSASPSESFEYISGNAEKLRLSVYTNLTYGVKGVQWFHAKGLFENGTTNLSKSGRDIAQLNKEMKAIGPVLVNLRSTDVFNTAPLPKGTREAPTEHWVHVIGEENMGGLVLGMFKDRDRNAFADNVETDYFMVANRDYNHSQNVVVRFQSKWLGIAPWHAPKTFTRSVEQFDRAKGEWKKISSSCAVGFVFNLAAGDGELFRTITTIQKAQ